MNLKKKARILLPDSCVLIGIVDPAGILEAGEIFVQVRKDSFSMHQHGHGMSKKKKRMEHAEAISTIDSLAEIVEGRVLVTRNPCTHPGDIRLLECVDRPELRHLFNVVVFSSKGERPQCNMMSGGDLDGDVYFVAWDKELIQYVKPENVKEAADYSKSELIKEKPDSDDLADYFVFYLQRDVLGTVSNLWLQLADHYGKDGPCHEDCIQLSHMCSVAVDFAKHGECVSKANYRHLQEIIKRFPDFLEKDNRPSFESLGVLGELYRDIKSDGALHEFIANDWRNSIALKYELDQNILDLVGVDAESKHQMHSYLSSVMADVVKPMSLTLKKAMMYFALANEGELFASDLKYRLCHVVGEKTFYAGDPGSKTEDAI
jgi:RNA-dependent RNA polymerase